MGPRRTRLMALSPVFAPLPCPSTRAKSRRANGERAIAVMCREPERHTRDSRAYLVRFVRLRWLSSSQQTTLSRPL
uniref:Putative secreted protein n=1 Tax=Anopheles triannulatus TaxID=58253 RepID=A0A2M4B648_9DIPT